MRRTEQIRCKAKKNTECHAEATMEWEREGESACRSSACVCGGSERESEKERAEKHVCVSLAHAPTSVEV